jgi:ribonuclease R/exosome complex exonuclease DIS3/RRP44
MRPDTELDREAYGRGTSVYLVDRCVPMLPENLSNGLCSLRPHEDKLCFSVVFKIDHNGHVLDEWFGRTVINSDHRFTYEEAQHIIESAKKTDFPIEIDNHLSGLGSVEDKVLVNELGKAILNLDKIAKKMRKTRLQKGSISFDKHEVRFKLDENNKPVDIIFKVGKDSNKLIEEYMLLANRHVAQYVNSRQYPMVNRAHEKPNEEKLEQLKTFISQFGYDIKIDTPEETTKTLNKLLLDVRGTAEEEMISNLVVRTMQKANYMTKNIGHYGLGFKNYSHFTSPIRRYPDVMVHRLLALYLDGKPKTLPNLNKLDAKCKHLSDREVKSAKAERDSIKYMQCVYMSDNIGKVYKGMVTSVTDYGLFVTIEENGCDGLIRLTDIGGDTYIADVENYRVKGYNTGSYIRLGDEVMVVVKSVDIEKKNINLTLLRL